MYTLFLCAFEQSEKKLTLHKWLTARNRDPTAGIPIKRLVPKDFTHNVVNACLSAEQLESVCWTNFCADTALDAFFSVDSVIMTDLRQIIYFKCVTFQFADIYTSAAGNAFFVIVSERRLSFLGFRVVTPLTAKRTSLDKDRCTYSGSVVNTKALYVKNTSKHYSYPLCLSRAIISS
jgi:hypothetical protein